MSGLSQKTSGLGGYIVSIIPPSWGGHDLNWRGIGATDKVTKRITGKRWRAKSRQMWQSEELD